MSVPLWATRGVGPVEIVVAARRSHRVGSYEADRL
jgi:hypothetical protein